MQDRNQDKVCGLKRPEDIESVNLAKPDLCGFIVEFPKSSRCVKAAFNGTDGGAGSGNHPGGGIRQCSGELPAELAETGVIPGDPAARTGRRREYQAASGAGWSRYPGDPGLFHSDDGRPETSGKEQRRPYLAGPGQRRDGQDFRLEPGRRLCTTIYIGRRPGNGQSGGSHRVAVSVGGGSVQQPGDRRTQRQGKDHRSCENRRSCGRCMGNEEQEEDMTNGRFGVHGQYIKKR